MKISRTNTNFSLQSYEHLKKMQTDKANGQDYAFLRYHQSIVKDFVETIDCDSQGLLIYHETGTGKSIMGVALSMNLIDHDRDIIVLCAKSLQTNFKTAIKQYINLHTRTNNLIADTDKWIDEKYKFVTMNASNMMKQMIKAVSHDISLELESKLNAVVAHGSLDGKVLIIDEAHNFFRAIVNGSENAQSLYKMIMRARGLKLFFLTGTPIASDPFEMSPCFNMLAGKIILPEEWSDFYKYFIDIDGIKNRAKLQNRIMGLVSFASGKSKNTTDPKTQFPAVYPLIIRYLPMDSAQYSQYVLAREKEMLEAKRGGPSRDTERLQKPKSGATSSYKQRSRQLSNYCPPDIADKAFSAINVGKLADTDIDAPKLRALMLDLAEYGKVGNGFIYSQFAGAGGLSTIVRRLLIEGWSLHSSQDLSDIYDCCAQEVFEEGDVNTDDKSGEHMNKHVTTPELYTPVDVVESVADIIEGAGNIADLLRFRDPYLSPGDITELKKQNKFIEDKDACAIITSLGNTTCIEFCGKPSAEFINRVVNKSAEEHIYYTICNTDQIKYIHKKNADVSHIGGAATPKKIFAVITGAVDVSIRAKIVADERLPENARGGIVDLILFTAAGAEGLDLKNIRYGIRYEEYWVSSRGEQVDGRGARAGSHIDLPVADRNFQPILYLCVKPISETGPIDYGESVLPELMTTDLEMYIMAKKGKSIIHQLERAIQEVSIECQMTGENCRVCAPNNKELFTNNIHKDIAAIDPCDLIKEKKITTTEIIVNGMKYYYVYNLDVLTVYYFDNKVGIYVQLAADTPEYNQIMQLIKPV